MTIIAVVAQIALLEICAVDVYGKLSTYSISEYFLITQACHCKGSTTYLYTPCINNVGRHSACKAPLMIGRIYALPTLLAESLGIFSYRGVPWWPTTRPIKQPTKVRQHYSAQLKVHGRYTYKRLYASYIFLDFHKPLGSYSRRIRHLRIWPQQQQKTSPLSRPHLPTVWLLNLSK